ncbi:MAG: invasion associated locus B family protein [Pseudomonadota bacterium]
MRGGMAVVLAVVGMQAVAQEQSTNRVAAQTDWSVFVEESPKECWGVSAPKETVNTRDGQVVSVRRGDILLFVTFRPGSGAAGEVSFTGGYPFANGSTATVEIAGNEYQLFTDGEWAWPASPEEDNRIVTAMKAGAEAKVTAVSGRGTTTTDTFSLMGFTAAMADAETRCAN